MVNKNVTKCNPKHIITCLQEITFSVQDCYQQSWLPVLAWVWMGGPHHWTGDLTGFSLPKVGNDTTTFLRQRPGQVHGKGPAQHLLQHFHKDLWYLLGKLCRNIAPVVSAGRTFRKISNHYQPWYKIVSGPLWWAWGFPTHKQSERFTQKFDQNLRGRPPPEPLVFLGSKIWDPTAGIHPKAWGTGRGGQVVILYYVP